MRTVTSVETSKNGDRHRPEEQTITPKNLTILTTIKGRSMGFLTGKRALITGLASDRSIAYGIAEAMRREGAEVALTYVGERFKERVEEMGKAIGASAVYDMDVNTDESIDATFKAIGAAWGSLDIVVHAIAFAPREALAGGFTDSTSREAFRVAHDVSSYSLTALARAAKPLMEGRNGAILTLSYLGAVKSVPSYNVMGLAKASLEANVRFLAADLGPLGIRVNAISAGPIKTLAAAGIAGFRQMLSHVAKVNPLRRNVTQEDVGNTAAFLCSDLAGGITGEVVYVDGGYSSVGMSFSDGT
jgi:enoyl-[acyl-carrier protein] reductase I